MFVIMPTNRHLMNTPAEAATAETRRMLERWGNLHAGRSALGLVPTLVFLWLSGELPTAASPRRADTCRGAAVYVWLGRALTLEQPVAAAQER